MKLLLAVALVQLSIAAAARAEQYHCPLPYALVRWSANPDGSCVQCSGVLHGLHMNDPATYWLLWPSKYGKAERGGSYPSRVAAYARARGMRIYNVTGSSTWAWLRWCAKTNRLGTPMGAGRAHFQSLWGWDVEPNDWHVMNNGARAARKYTWSQFQSLHRASGEWIWVIDKQPPPPPPAYVAWWQ